MKWNKTKMEIYLFAVGSHKYGGGYHWDALKIANTLDVSMSYVCRVFRQLLHDGFITPTKAKTKPKLYEPTKRSPLKQFTLIEKMATGITPVNLADSTGHERGRVFTTSNTSWSCSLNYIPDDLEKHGWQRKEMAYGSIQYCKKIYFQEPINAPLLFQIIGKRKFTITVQVPPFTFDDLEQFNDSKVIILDYVKMALKTISQKYHIAMTLSKTYLSNGEFEHPLRDADIKQFINTAQVTIKYHKGLSYIGKLEFNGSGKVDRIESNLPEWIADYAEIPSFRKNLEELQKEISEIKKELPEIKSLMLDLKKELSEIRAIFSQPKIPDSFVDVT
jgi:hypothetical protein